MGSYKPRSKSDRLPVTSGPASSVQVDPVPSRDALLVLAPLTREERDARNAAAVRYLLRHQSGDLVEMLGLAAVPVVARLASSRITVMSVGCPQCGAGSGARCFVTATGMATPKPHTARRRKAALRREAT